MNYDQKVLAQHKQLGGKISISLKDNLESKDKLSIYYTPGVAAVSRHIADNPDSAKEYTWLNNTVAVVSDGSAVLGLGNIGSRAALPVMEGKAMLFKHFANIDAVPIVLDVHTTEEIVASVIAIAPSFGAVNLEDIAAPQCFEIEEQLKSKLAIPVMHDDQHGTAVVVLAGLINAAKLTKRKISSLKVVVAGAGAAGIATAKLLHVYGITQLTAVDSKGIIEPSRNDLNPEKKLLLKFSDKVVQPGSLSDAIKDADVFIGVSRAGLLTPQMIQLMAADPIIFALANPQPEVLPDIAYGAGAAVVATGRSDFPNQVNNALAFPGIFRGALDNNITEITDNHKLKTAEAIAGLVKRPSKFEIIPSVLDERLVPAIAKLIT